MYYVYILTNWNHSVLYIGVTGDIARRVLEHKSDKADGFCKKYKVNKLVYCESSEDIHGAITREKQLKRWTRKKKDELITSANPGWEEIPIGL